MFGCINKQKKQTANDYFPIIKLTYDEDKTIKLSEFVDSNHVVLLDDGNENYIGNISKIDIIDSLIVITDISTKTVLIYNFGGELINSIKAHGRGPGEFLNIELTWVNHETKEIAIYDRSQLKILFFNLDGNFIKSLQSPTYICGFASNAEYSYYYRSQDGLPDNNGQPSNIHLIMTSSDSIRLDMKRDYFIDNSTFNPFQNFYRSKNKILLLIPQEQNIYELSGMTKTLKYHIELNPSPIWENENYKSIKTFNDLKSKEDASVGKIGGLRFIASNRYVLFLYSKLGAIESKSFYAVYDMEKNLEILTYRSIINDIDGFTTLNSPIFFNDSLWISTLHQYQLDEDGFKAIEDMYKIDFSKSLNPILIISKLNFNE